MHIFYAISINNCMLLKLRDLLTKIKSLPNENVSCGCGEIVSDLYYIHHVAPLVGSLYVSL